MIVEMDNWTTEAKLVVAKMHQMQHDRLKTATLLAYLHYVLPTHFIIICSEILRKGIWLLRNLLNASCRNSS